MNLPIIVFGDLTGRYISAIESQRGEVSVARHAQDFSELIGLAQTGIARAVLIVGDHEELTYSIVDQLYTLEVSVVVVTDPEEKPELESVHWVSTLANDSEILVALAESVRSIGEDERGYRGAGNEPVEDQSQNEEESLFARDGAVISVWGGYGSPGRSTVAVNLSAYAAFHGHRVCLVDADTYAPSVSPLVGMLEDFSGLSQLCHLADRGKLSVDKLAAATGAISVAGATVDILTGITKADRWPEIRGQSLAMVLEYLREHYDLIIVDTAACLEEDEELSFDGIAPRRNSATRTALAGADIVVLVGSGDVLGVPRLLHSYENLTAFYEEVGVSPVTSIWLNKLRKQATGGNPQEGIERAWHRFGPAKSISGFIPYDMPTVDKSLLNGKTLIELAPKSEVASAFERMMDHLLPLLEVRDRDGLELMHTAGSIVRRTPEVDESGGQQGSSWFRKISRRSQKISR